MTHLGTVIILLVCVGVGYVVEPMLFSGVKQDPAPQPAQPTETAAKDQPNSGKPKLPIPVPTPEPTPEPSVQLDLTKVTREDFPEKVSLKAPYTFADANSGVTMQLKKGTKVKPVRLEGTDLVIQPIGFPVESKIHVDKTNFKELAAPRVMERLKNAVAENTNQPEAPAPVEPEPEPEPEPTPEPESTKLDEAAVVALMKQSVKAGKVTEFKANQVTSWKAGEDMQFDGETYQTGLVKFKAQTILGVQEHEAIALIEDGAVYKWMWAKTKLEMR